MDLLPVFALYDGTIDTANGGMQAPIRSALT